MRCTLITQRLYAKFPLRLSLSVLSRVRIDGWVAAEIICTYVYTYYLRRYLSSSTITTTVVKLLPMNPPKRR